MSAAASAEPISPTMAARELLLTIWAPGASEEEIPIPVNPVAIANRLGIKVYTAGLDPSVAGVLIKRPGQDLEIHLNAKDSENRQRFTCAHELGHYVKRSATGQDQHWAYIDTRAAISGEGTDPDEIFANQFAAELLMPRPIVAKLAKEFGVPVMAFKLGVSTDALNFRLKNLGLK